LCREKLFFAREVPEERGRLALQPADLGDRVPTFREIADDPAIDCVQPSAQFL
jgi:hypothetical protein